MRPDLISESVNTVKFHVAQAKERMDSDRPIHIVLWSLIRALDAVSTTLELIELDRKANE